VDWSYTPIQVGGALVDHSVIGMATGGAHTCAVTDEHEVYCWGHNDHGQVGATVVPGDAFAPWHIDLPGAPGRTVGVTTGTNHTCAWTTVGELYCWGQNSTVAHQLGIPSAGDHALPWLLFSLTLPVTGAAAGTDHTCAWSTGGQVYCWGLNTSGQSAGHVLAGWTLVEAVVTKSEGDPLIDIVGMDAGAAHSCGWTITGQAWCWGSDAEGQLGNGADRIEDYPVLVHDPWAGIE
jgi:alpha-tubulin suppressor-like RCC1 family protein